MPAESLQLQRALNGGAPPPPSAPKQHDGHAQVQRGGRRNPTEKGIRRLCEGGARLGSGPRAGRGWFPALLPTYLPRRMSLLPSRQTPLAARNRRSEPVDHPYAGKRRIMWWTCARMRPLGGPVRGPSVESRVVPRTVGPRLTARHSAPVHIGR